VKACLYQKLSAARDLVKSPHLHSYPITFLLSDIILTGFLSSPQIAHLITEAEPLFSRAFFEPFPAAFIKFTPYFPKKLKFFLRKIQYSQKQV
jgi:hypothetical protein